jgi:pilus assembly protein Flp/PilA
MSDDSPRGQGLVEYALLIILVGVVIVVVLTLFGPAVGNLFSNIMMNL